MALPTVYLIDNNPEMIAAWNNCFEGVKGVRIILGDYFSAPTEAIVSPANSFGIMDGGLDIEIAHKVGHKAIDELRGKILDQYFGEVPVGAAITVSVVSDCSYFALICAPTMRIPENVSQTLNAFHAFRGTLGALKFSGIESVTVPAFCHGIGGMSPLRVASQMKVAFDQMSKPARIPSYSLIHETHTKMTLQS